MRVRLRPLAPLVWLGPSLILIGAVIVYPLFELVRTSMFSVDIAGETTNWVGLRNYGWVFQDPALGGVLTNTAVWVLGCVAGTILVSVPLAYLLDQRFPGRKLVRATLIVPWVAPLVVTASIWRWLLDYFYGLINALFKAIGVINSPHDWLGAPAGAVAWMVLVGILVSVPFTTYVLLAGMQTTGHDLRDAARVDGCTRWRAFLSVTLPLLRPALILVVLFNTIFVFNSLPIVLVMTGGGPGNQTDTLATWVYKLAFSGGGRVDEAAALSILNVLLLSVVVVVLLSCLRAAIKGVGRT